MTLILIGLILFCASTIHALSGFAFGLVSVPLLQLVIPIPQIAPLVTLAAIVVSTGLSLYHRQAIQLQRILPLAFTAILTVPLGVYGSSRLPTGLFLLILGILLTGYATYGLVKRLLPPLQSRWWGYLAGGLSGFLGGLVNMGGPPVIIYAQSQQWEPEVFKSNLQGFFLVNLVVIVISRAVQGDFTLTIWRLFIYSLPAIGLGLGSGLWLSRWLDPVQFRRMILIMLASLGISLLIRAILLMSSV